MITRRTLAATAAAAALSACAPPVETTRAARLGPPPELPPAGPPVPDFYGAVLDEPFPVPAVPEGVVPPHLWRQETANPFPADPAGSLVVDPDAMFLYLVQGRDRALRYGVSVGAAGFGWSGLAQMRFRRRWPRWTAPDGMVARRPDLEPWSIANGGMDGGPGNPLGARALYLFQNNADTLYRIHGACEPEFLGKAVSSGCIRLLDQDAIDLHDRVRDGVQVRVVPSLAPPPFTLY